MAIHEVGLSCRTRSGIQWYERHGLRVGARNDNTGRNDGTGRNDSTGRNDTTGPNDSTGPNDDQ